MSLPWMETIIFLHKAFSSKRKSHHHLTSNVWLKNLNPRDYQNQDLLGYVDQLLYPKQLKRFCFPLNFHPKKNFFECSQAS